MPYHVRHRPVKSRKNWAIIDEQGRIVGRSTSKEKAERSVHARLAGEHGWRKKR